MAVDNRSSLNRDWLGTAIHWLCTQGNIKTKRIFFPQVRSCRDAPILFPGLILRWSGYDKTVGGVERVMPSVCGAAKCEPGFSGEECDTLEKDKVPPTVEYCPPGTNIRIFTF